MDIYKMERAIFYWDRSLTIQFGERLNKYTDYNNMPDSLKLFNIQREGRKMVALSKLAKEARFVLKLYEQIPIFSARTLYYMMRSKFRKAQTVFGKSATVKLLNALWQGYYLIDDTHGLRFDYKAIVAIKPKYYAHLLTC